MVNFNVTSTRGCSKINFSNKMHELIEPLTSSAGSTISMRLSLNTGGGRSMVQAIFPVVPYFC